LLNTAKMRNIFFLAAICLLQLSTLVGVSEAAPSLAGVNSFGYQRHNASVAGLTTAPYDLVIVDYSKDGSDAQAFTKQEIAAVKSAGKKVLAYLSIGEAEEHRYYFKSRWVGIDSNAPCGKVPAARAPGWLAGVNPTGCESYKVKYWDLAWQRILFGVKGGQRKSYLDKIIDAGFDGVYLDAVDGYKYWRSQPGAARRITAAQEMATLVIKLARYAREVRGRINFVVVPQNGAEILGRVAPSLRHEYLKTIQGIGAEDTFYVGPGDEDNPLDPQPALGALKRFAAAGKKVFAVDYLLDNEKIANFAHLACQQGFIPQVASRALDTLDPQVLDGCHCVFGVGGYVC